MNWIKKFSLSVLVFSNSLLAQNWTQLNLPGQTNLHCCSFSPVNTDKGWFAGYFMAGFDFHPFAYSTQDGGLTFNSQDLTASGLLKAEDIYFKDDNVGFIVGMGISKTFDGGTNWLPEVDGIGMRGTANDLYYSNNNLYAVGQRYDFNYQFFEGFIYKSNDDGFTFLDYRICSDTSNQNTDLRAVFSTGNNVCYAGAFSSLGTGSTLYKSTDDGVSWVSLNFTKSINSLFFKSADEGFAATTEGIYQTTDAGATWTNIQPTTHSLNSIKILNLFGLAVGDSGTIYKTDDGGITWKLMLCPVTTDLHKVTIISPSLAYATGPGSGIKYENLTSIEEHSINPKTFQLEQNFPNPFNPSTKIKYNISQPGFVQLKVYDVIGNELAILVNEEKPAGSYEVEFNSSVGSLQLASGIYFYRLQIGDFISSKKMILLK
jgi:photosystem II stability/assembly factor-like uncharacterized protein